jgi:hypothetical protein
MDKKSMKTAICVLLAICGCQSGTAVTNPAPHQLQEPNAAPQKPVASVEDVRDFITRTTVEGGTTLTVRLPADSRIGHPIQVVVELTNRDEQPLLLTYSQPIRFIWPAVWYNRSGRMPLTAKGQKPLGNGEEFSNRTGELQRGQTWKFAFDVAELYDLSLAHDYTLSLTCLPERDDPPTGKRTVTQFQIAGIRLHVRNEK